MVGVVFFIYFVDGVLVFLNCMFVLESFGQFLVEIVGFSGIDDCDLNVFMFFGDIILINFIVKRVEWVVVKNIVFVNFGDLFFQGIVKEVYEIKEVVYRSLLGKFIVEGVYEQVEEVIL